VEEELLLGGEELPVEEILQLAPVHREQLGARAQAHFIGDRLWFDSGDPNHLFLASARASTPIAPKRGKDRRSWS
jgi:hypothetical protein